MTDYIKANHLSLLIVVYLVFGSYLSPMLGASPAASLTRVTNDWQWVGSGTDITVGGDVSVGDDFTVTDDAAITGDLIVTSVVQRGGGTTATSTTDTTATFLASDFDPENVIEFMPLVPSITATLPATGTITSFLQGSGATREFLLCNSTTTALQTFTFAVGTGMNLHQATSSLTIMPGTCATMTWVRAADTDIEVFYDSGW